MYQPLRAPFPRRGGSSFSTDPPPRRVGSHQLAVDARVVCIQNRIFPPAPLWCGSQTKCVAVTSPDRQAHFIEKQ